MKHLFMDFVDFYEYPLQSHYFQYYSNISQAQPESYFGEQIVLKSNQIKFYLKSAMYI